MNSNVTLAGVITRISTNLASFIWIIIWCMLYSWIITLQDFYSFLRRVFRLLSRLLGSWKDKNDVDHDHDITTTKPCHSTMITREDMEVVMEKLGLKKLHDQEPWLEDSCEIVSVFENAEPRLDEVREAFRVFDEDDDGYVDAKELRRVMCSLGLVGLSEKECQRMIVAFDEDGDGRIDFGEFVKLIEENVCS